MNLLDKGDFMPHGHCYLWVASLIRLHFFTDLAIGMAYIAISGTLAYLVHKARKDIPFSWIFICFGLFIIACGATHFIEIWTLWVPLYWLSGSVKLVTAVASVATAIVLPPLVPKSLALIRSAKLWEQRQVELEAANQALQKEIGERKRAEEELRELYTRLEERVDARTAELSAANMAQAGLAAIVESSNDAMVSLDLDQRITTWNPAAERIYGFRKEGALGHSVSILAPAHLSGETAELVERVKRGEHINSFETIHVRNTGEPIHVSISLSPIRNEAGEFQGTSIVARDITERKRGEEMFRLAVDAAPNAMVIANNDGNIVLVNAQTEKLFGYRREELIGQKVTILVPHKYRDKHPAYQSEFMRQPQARAMGAGRDLYGLRKDGSEFPVEIGLNPIQTEQGAWVLSAIVDITERKRGEEMFRLAVDAAPNAMVIANNDGNIVLVNAQTEKLFGYRREELIGQKVTILVPHKYRDKHPAYQSEFMRQPQARAMGAGRDLYGLRKDGSEFPVEIGLNPIQTEQGTWVLSAIVDITERKRAQEQISLLNRDLERRVAERTTELTAANAELEAFSYSISHDLRAPLRQVAGFSRIIAEEYGPGLTPECERYLRMVQDGAEQMGHMVDDLLDLSRIGRQMVSRHPTPLGPILDAALAVIQPDLQNREIDWQIQSLCSVEGDPRLLKQVFVNLLSNAVKFTRGRDRACIQVGQTTLDEEPVIFVRDNGAGFDMRYASKLFGVFQRLHKARDFEGYGVGLALVQRIIRKHGGRIWAEAEENKGATFFFTLPNGRMVAPGRNADSEAR